MISYCPAAAIPQLVDVVRPLIDLPLKRQKLESMYRTADILDACLRGTMALWVAGAGHKLEGIVVTTVIEYPAGAKHLDITLVGGSNMKAWLPDIVK
jgi:hypothetical protein